MKSDISTSSGPRCPVFIPLFSECPRNPNSAMASDRRRDWANLLPEILTFIAQRLTALDYMNFSAVCSSWASIASPANGMPPPLPLRKPHPFLLLTGGGGEQSESRCTLLDAFDDNRLYNLDPLPEMSGKRFIGSQFGWLTIASTESPDLFLFNPFTRARIDLPAIVIHSDLPPLLNPVPIHRGAFRKVILSSDPNRGNFTAVAMFGDSPLLALFRTGEKAWSFWDNLSGIADAVYWGGKAVAVSEQGSVYEIELSHSPGTTVVDRLIAGSSYYDCFSTQYPMKSQYLVESPSGDLLRVSKDHSYGIEVQILKPKLKTEPWVSVTSFRSLALFVSPTCSMFVSTTRRRVKENCVYLADRDEVFDIRDKNFVAWPLQLPTLNRTGHVWIMSPCFEADARW